MATTKVAPATITVAEAARQVGVSKFTLYRWIKEDGWPPQVQCPGRTVRVSVARLESWLAGSA